MSIFWLPSLLQAATRQFLSFQRSIYMLSEGLFV